MDAHDHEVRQQARLPTAHQRMDDHDPLAIERGREQLAEVARAILRGDLGVVAGARAINRLRHEVAADPVDPDFLRFVAIDADTDELPVETAERDRWDPAALAAQDAEIAEAEAHWREAALEGCRRLIERFAKSRE
jgi:hypothetical protein